MYFQNRDNTAIMSATAMKEIEEKPSGEKLWQKIQDTLAERAGLSVLIVDGHQPPALAVSNNNSICRVVQSSATHAERCEPFCGQAFQKATEAGKAINYRCHAGLYCVAAPLENEEKPLVAIVGRAFTKTSDYRDLTERIFLGDWQNLPEIELFENVNLSGSNEDLEKLAARLQNLNAEERASLSAFIKKTPEVSEEEAVVLPEIESEESIETENDVLELETLVPDSEEILFLDEEESLDSKSKQSNELETGNEEVPHPIYGEIDELKSVWRVNIPFEHDYLAAVSYTLEFIAEKFGLENLAWLEKRGQSFATRLQRGEKFGGDIGHIQLQPGDELIKQAADKKTSLRLENKNTGDEIELFPVVWGFGKINSAVVIADSVADQYQHTILSNFINGIGSSLENIWLRESVRKQAHLETAVKKFNSDLQNSSAENFLDALVENSAAMVGAERASLLFFDENEQVLRAAATTGARADEIKNDTAKLGDRVALRIFQEKTPIVVSDVSQLNLPTIERGYKSSSFLCLPLKVSGRAVGVLNVTEKSSGAPFDDTDLQLLEAVAPQIAIALDRARLHERAGEFEVASITDSLTGLRNRRYLEGRLDEEIRRSQRHGYPVSFMMIDVDYFKKYNDSYGHQAGDEALKIVANCLRSTLRGADVAVRYGGEEFSVLLPQTTQSEAKVIAERIRRRIESTVFPHDKITISGGIAAFTSQLDTAQAVIKAADRALYAAKSAGRNNIQIYSNGNGGGAV